MTTLKTLTATSLIALLAACGGSSGGAPQVTGPEVDEPEDVAEVEDTVIDVSDTLDSNGISTATITLDEVDGLISEVAGISGATNLTLSDLENLEADALDFSALTEVDVTAPGSASYSGMILMADIADGGLFDAETNEILISDVDPNENVEDDPDFLLLGRTTLNATFGENPDVTGGANGFVGLNIEAAAAIEDDLMVSNNSTIGEIFDQLPTIEVDGSLTYSNGGFLQSDEIDVPGGGLAFDVDGAFTLPAALTGQDSAVDATVAGAGVAGFAGDLALGGVTLEGTNGSSPDLGGAFVATSN